MSTLQKILFLNFEFICIGYTPRLYSRAMSKKATSEASNWLSVLPFTTINYVLFFIGLFVIALGYVLMGTGELNSTQSLTVSPIVLLVGYVVIIPFSIMYRGHEKESK